MDIKAYISIARPDHWFKNGFMLIGVILAFFLEPVGNFTTVLLNIFYSIISVCLVASSNYVINEVLDAPFDKHHPEKCNRPVPSGRVYVPFAYAEWIILAIVGLYFGWLIGWPFFFSALSLWVAGLAYNIPPIRTKEIPFIDVLSESLNNPIRLFMGWFALVSDKIPPVSIIIAYWMAGAFFMGAKRFAEFRMINDPEVAGKYRASFKYYTSEKLLLSLFFYMALCNFFFGIFVIRYHLELILGGPFFAGLFAYYLKITFWENSPVQKPEKLYHEKKLMGFIALSVISFIVLLYSRIPILYELFNVIPYNLSPLWGF